MQILRKSDALAYISTHAALFDAAGAQNPFASSAWMSHFIEQVATDEWVFAIAETQGGDSGAFLYATSGKPNQFAAVSNYYASLYSPILGVPGNCASAAASIVRQVTSRRPRCAIVDLAPLDESSSETKAIRDAFAAAGWYVKTYFCFGNWFVRTAGLSFEQYMAQRPSQLRNTCVRKRRKFDSAGGRLEIIDGTNGSVEAGIAAFTSVYSKSWKRPEPYPRFVPVWAEICARKGWLRLGVAWMKGLPIAAQFWFTSSRKAYIFKLAYDENQASWSAGTLLTAHMIQHSIDQDRVEEIDYLTGDDDYKKAWMSSRRVRIGLRACNTRTLSGHALATYELLGNVKHRIENSKGEALS